MKSQTTPFREKQCPQFGKINGIFIAECGAKPNR